MMIRTLFLLSLGVIAPTAASLADTASPDAATAKASFTPPTEAQLDRQIPKGPFGDMVRLGQKIFNDTGTYAPEYVGNSLSCANCHLAGGTLADSAPMWAAYPAYPAYRGKNKQVNSYQQRLQGCFRYSMNGKAPPFNSKVLLALESYSYFMAKGAPTGDAQLPGRGYPKLSEPKDGFDITRGQKVYEARCAICHGANGEGQQVNGKTVFPPLWGSLSYNWGAGMHRVSTAAAFIHANMPLGMPKSLSEQQAWDVAAYIDSRPRPQDPRFAGSVSETRKRFHDNDLDYYGKTVDGQLLGDPANTPPSGTVLTTDH